MSTPTLLDLATHFGHVWRRGAQCREGVVLRDCEPGWVRHTPGKPPGDAPSAAATRVMWTSSGLPLDERGVASARDVLRDLGVTRAFVWLSPLSWNDGTDAMLAAAGATPWPHVEYPLLVRSATPLATDRGGQFHVRRIGRQEAGGVLAQVAPWYGPESIPAALQGIEHSFAEFHAAFHDSKPVAMGAIIPDGVFAYLGWMGTDPAFRGQGAQAALIAARVNRAAELGAAWCTAETNTTIPTSLRNLERAGFTTRLTWRVYRWDL